MNSGKLWYIKLTNSVPKFLESLMSVSWASVFSSFVSSGALLDISPITGSTVVGLTVTGSTVVVSTVVGSTVVGSTVVGSTVTGSTVVGLTMGNNDLRSHQCDFWVDRIGCVQYSFWKNKTNFFDAWQSDIWC
ncbi:uncharacterized protein EV154DRAFT_196127 [Mucor mucedo]|uniref:uncharacterized protein n=1 Tax=Mucor mucedo TaxID=29922 RepID=UPI002220D479|nr:uncharacterized protein EV154DRAFT_196127 [Mucor mucedo]KAI7892261.1 hypothetical protein EV154DRAFT_196127 [Mucor mucedo]